MEEIKKLDDKYIVVKREDVHKYLDDIPPEERPDKEEQFYNCLNTITRGRDNDRKPFNKYVVLNLDDEIDLIDLKHSLVAQTMVKEAPYKVKDIAVDLVNAILKAKGD